ncbi:DUF2169 family type VI secretion system accessory protein [Neisseria sp. Ec49-e6-T10]|uniref:DUF2169 family type VI secretion system accessory protein n=1 Tax=Neisseria sp. Ec49-e6-T10 TaxID=3140744 RepID=UPI003EC03DF7
MLELDNLTGFPAQNYISIDQLDRSYDVIAAKVSYDFEIDRLTGQTELSFTTIQSELCMADEHYGAETKTSVQYESDLSPYKPYLDIIVNGTAYAPFDKPSKRFGAAISVGDYQKALAITGPRCWQKHGLGWSLGEPVAISQLPIKYEYAFGGMQYIEEELQASLFNPIGIGWYPTDYLKKLSTSNVLAAPQITHPSHPLEHISKPIRTEGFGFYGRSWQDRLQYSGTADEQWLKDRHPLLPTDFDMHYWNGAHPDLQFAHPKPNQIYDIKLFGLVRAQDVPKQHIALHIPVETLFAFIKTKQNIGLCKDLTLDTILICVEERKIYCTYRVCLAEELEADQTQLRFIAKDQRQEQLELAQTMLKQNTDWFIPTPPSLTQNLKQKTI